MTVPLRVVLLSTYELGRQPFGLASPAAWLRRAGADVTCVDLSRDRLDPESVRAAQLVALYLPMHTATRLALPVIDGVRALNPQAHLCAFGLYAPLNEAALRHHGVETVLGPEFEADLVEVARAVADDTKLESLRKNSPDYGLQASGFSKIAPVSALRQPAARSPQPTDSQPLKLRPTTQLGPTTRSPRGLPRLDFIVPDRAGLPPLTRYASVQHGPARLVTGYTEASRGCKHVCRHCPIVPIYQGRFRVVPAEVVLADIRQQVRQGARHITFGDPDFFNGIGHARRVIDGFHRVFRHVTYDVTIKIEHLLRHRDALPHLRDTGCLFVTSAVESIDDRVLSILEKGHTRDDFLEVVRLCRGAGVVLSPTFVPFTPWTTADTYAELLETIDALDLVDHVAPIQLAIRLLVTTGSRLLELSDIQRVLNGSFDEEALTYRWSHPDPRVDELQDHVMRLVGARPAGSRREVFEAICDLTRDVVNRPRRMGEPPLRHRATIPYLTEPWYC
ncbi:MAG: radical SAM protein [Acidobacteria bacterium]|nr:radical SAM protein [Acidobacteriota bacterium]